MPEILQELLNSPKFILILIGLYLFLKKTPAIKKRRRILAVPPEPKPPTEGEAFEALGTLVDRMAACGVDDAERRSLHDQIVPKIISPKE